MLHVHVLDNFPLAPLRTLAVKTEHSKQSLGPEESHVFLTGL